jgi:hypothetical protein
LRGTETPTAAQGIARRFHTPFFQRFCGQPAFHSGPGTLLIHWGYFAKYEKQFGVKLWHWRNWLMRLVDEKDSWNYRINSYREDPPFLF